MKKTVFILTLCFSLIIGLVGCNMDRSSSHNDLQRLSQIEIYSSDGKLINTIVDKETLILFNNIDGTDILDDTDYEEDELQHTVGNLPVLYTIISYKTSAALHNDGTLEKLAEMTIYSDSNIIKEQIAPDNIKVPSIPEEYLVFYMTITDEDKNLLLSLAELQN